MRPESTRRASAGALDPLE